VKDWFHAFSGGQKQRCAMARLFYHRPKYAILDECTSAVSDEVEGTIYASCRLLGITIFTVSHRPSLAKYHNTVLRFEGETRWSVKEIDSQAEIEKEKREKAILAAAFKTTAQSASSTNTVTPDSTSASASAEAKEQDNGTQPPASSDSLYLTILKFFFQQLQLTNRNSAVWRSRSRPDQVWRRS
jgi:ABC-type methionine transport system ATPase subunit